MAEHPFREDLATLSRPRWWASVNACEQEHIRNSEALQTSLGAASDGELGLRSAPPGRSDLDPALQAGGTELGVKAAPEHHDQSDGD
jgi:hypothetical protein